MPVNFNAKFAETHQGSNVYLYTERRRGVGEGVGNNVITCHLMARTKNVFNRLIESIKKLFRPGNWNYKQQVRLDSVHKALRSDLQPGSAKVTFLRAYIKDIRSSWCTNSDTEEKCQSILEKLPAEQTQTAGDTPELQLGDTPERRLIDWDNDIMKEMCAHFCNEDELDSLQQMDRDGGFSKDIGSEYNSKEFASAFQEGLSQLRAQRAHDRACASKNDGSAGPVMRGSGGSCPGI